MAVTFLPLHSADGQSDTANGSGVRSTTLATTPDSGSLVYAAVRVAGTDPPDPTGVTLGGISGTLINSDRQANSHVAVYRFLGAYASAVIAIDVGAFVATGHLVKAYQVEGAVETGSGADSVVQSGINHGGSGVPITLSLTTDPTSTNTVIAFFGQLSTSAITVPSGWDHEFATMASPNSRLDVLYDRTDPPQTVAPTYATAAAWAGVIIEVADAGGAGGSSVYDDEILAHPDLEAYYPLATSGEDLQGTADGVAVNVAFGQPPVITSTEQTDESAQFDGASGGVIPSGGAGYAAEVAADSPVHHWRAGEASGTLVDGPGTADGTASGTMTRNVTGLINATDDDGAVDLGGGYFDLADAITALDTTWTLETWIRIDDLTGGGRLLYFFDGTGGATKLDLAYLDTGIPRLTWTDSSGANRILDGAGALSVGQTYHLAASHDGTTAHLYVNGVEDAATSSWNSRTYGAADFTIRRIGSPADPLQGFTHLGVIDEVAIYDTTLSAARTLAHYNAGVAGVSTIPDLGDTWSVEVWAAPSAPSLTTREYFVSAHTGANAVFGLWRFGDSGRSSLSWNDSTDTGHSIGGSIMSAGLAHHLVATHDGSTATLVHNGIVVATDAFDSRGMDDLTWKLGGWSSSDQFVLVGRMQKVAIYSAALSLADIREHYELGTGGVNFNRVDSIAPAAQSEATATVIYHAVGDSIHAEPEVAGEIETEESVLSAVGKSVAISFDVRALAGKSLAISYQLLAGAGDVWEYDESALTYDDSSATYDGEIILELVAVGRDLAISYNVLTAVGKSLDLAWNVRAAVGRDLVIRYSVQVIIVVERAPRYEIDWDGTGFEAFPAIEDISFSWRRGAGADLDSQAPSSATLVLHNADDRYTDTNLDSDLYERLRPNARFRAVVDFDGTLRPLWAGYLSDMAPNVDIPEVDLVFDDLLHRLSQIEVEVPYSAGRTFGEYRQAVLEAAGVPTAEMDLDDENEVMVDTADYGSGTALSLLEAINTATGTRHFIRPGAGDPWQQYVSVNRQHNLTQSIFDIEVNDTEHIETGSGGWRTAWDTVINRQRITANGEVQYPEEAEEVWVADHLPIQVPASGSKDIWALNTGSVKDVSALVFGVGLTTQSPTAYADSVKVTVAAGPSGGLITSMAIWGRPGRSGSNETITEDNTVSIATYGRHDGAARSAVGSVLSSAEGTAEHIVWRYGEPRKQPSANFSNPEEHYIGRDLFDLVGFSMARVFVADRRMELIGEEGSILRGVIRMTWQLQDTPEQTPSNWFILNTSTLNSTAKLGY